MPPKKCKITWKEIVNPHTLKKFKGIKWWYDKFDKEGNQLSKDFETGFCIDKNGKIFPNKYDTDMIVGANNTIKLSATCKFGYQMNELGRMDFKGDEGYDHDPKYTVHSHPGFHDPKHFAFNRYFSPDDLIVASQYEDIPCITYKDYAWEVRGNSKKRKVYEDWKVKCHFNPPKDRMEIINIYGKIFNNYNMKENELLNEFQGGDILKLSREEYHDFNNKVDQLQKETGEILKKYEDDNCVETKKLFSYWRKIE